MKYSFQNKRSSFQNNSKKIEAVTPTIPNACYKSYEEFVKRVLNLKLSSEWNIQEKNNSLRHKIGCQTQDFITRDTYWAKFKISNKSFGMGFNR